MLTTIFSLGGSNYKSNRIPDSYESLKLAAAKIYGLMNLERRPNTTFQFSFTTPAMTEAKPISDDTGLMAAINRTF